MNRRGFLKALGLSPTLTVLDVKGMAPAKETVERVVVHPNPIQYWTSMSVGETVEIDWERHNRL